MRTRYAESLAIDFQQSFICNDLKYCLVQNCHSSQSEWCHGQCTHAHAHTYIDCSAQRTLLINRSISIYNLITKLGLIVYVNCCQMCLHRVRFLLLPSHAYRNRSIYHLCYSFSFHPCCCCHRHPPSHRPLPSSGHFTLFTSITSCATLGVDVRCGIRV